MARRFARVFSILSRRRNQPFELLLTRYVIERLLYRQQAALPAIQRLGGTMNAFVFRSP
jgi:hypothetical protein